MVAEKFKEAIPEIISLANLNGMVVIDKMTEKLEKCPEFANTTVSKKFQKIAYDSMQLPGAVAKDVIVDSVDKLQKALDEYETNVKQTLAEKNSSDNNDGKNKDDVPTENHGNVSPSDGSNTSLSEVPVPENKNIPIGDISSGTNNQKEDLNVETQIEPNLIKND